MKNLKTLVLELASTDPAVRKGALVALANTRIPQAYPHLAKAAGDDPDPAVRTLAAKAVEGFHKLGLSDDAENDDPLEPTVTMIASPDNGVLDKVKHFLIDNDPAVRIKAALACVRLNNTGARLLLLQGFIRESDPTVKARMIQGLIASHDADTLDSTVLPVVKEGGKSLQAAALESIGSSGRSDLASFALTFAADPDPIVRTRAKAAMKRIGQASCVAALVSMAQSSNAGTRTDAAVALAQVPIRESVDLLRSLAADADETVREAAVSTVEDLAGNGNPQAMVLARELGMSESADHPEVNREIFEALASESSCERSAAARRIASERPEGTLPAVLERMDVEDEELVCIELLNAVGKIGNPDIIYAVKPYLGHMKVSLRARAVEALSRCACPEAYPLIALALYDPAPEVRGRAVVGIRPYGHIDVEVHLREMLLSDDRQMQAEAVSVVREIADDEIFGVLDQRALRSDPVYLEKAAEALRAPEEAGSTRAASIRNRLLGHLNSSTVGRKNTETIKVSRSSNPQLETMRLLKAFDKLTDGEKLSWIAKITENRGAAEFNALTAIVETDSDETIKSVAIRNLKHFTGLGFTDFGIRPAGTLTHGKSSTPEKAGPSSASKNTTTLKDADRETGSGKAIETAAGINSKTGSMTHGRIVPKVVTINYEGRKSLATLQDGLKEREKMYNVRNYWEGSFPRSQILINSLREDTQEMIGRALPLNEKPQWACFCFYSREIREFISGLKSSDGPATEKLMNLDSAASSISEGADPSGSPVDPAFAPLFAEVRKPKYLLLIQTRNFLVFFLRSHLSEKISSFFHISLEGISGFRLEFKDDKANAHLDLPGGHFTVPDLCVDDAYTLEESLKPRIEE